MTRDALRRLRDANPVIDPDLLVAPSDDEPLHPRLRTLLGRDATPTASDHRHLDERVRHMQPDTRPETLHPTPDRGAATRWLPRLVAAAAALTIVVAVAAAIAPRESAPVAPPPPPPADTAAEPLDSLVIFAFRRVWDEGEAYYGPTGGSCGSRTPDVDLVIASLDGEELARATAERGRMRGEMGEAPVYCHYEDTFDDLPALPHYDFRVLDEDGSIITSRAVTRGELDEQDGLVLLQVEEPAG